MSSGEMTDRVKQIIANAHIGAVDISQLTAEEHGQLVRHIQATMPGYVTVDMKTLTNSPPPGTHVVNEIPLGPWEQCKLTDVRISGPKTVEEAREMVARGLDIVNSLMRVTDSMLLTTIKPTPEQIAKHQAELSREVMRTGCQAGIEPTSKPYALKRKDNISWTEKLTKYMDENPDSPNFVRRPLADRVKESNETGGPVEDLTEEEHRYLIERTGEIPL